MKANKLKKLLFVSRNSLAGAPYYDIALPALFRDGWCIDVAAVDADESIVKKHIGYEAKVFNIPKISRINHEITLAKVLIKSRLENYDVIYLCGHFVATRAWLYLFGPKMCKKIVYHNTDYFDPMTYPVHSRIEKYLCRKIDLYINDEYHRAYITRTYYKITCPIVVAPPNLHKKWANSAQSLDLRAELDGGCADAFILMNCGGFTPLRMIPELVTALATLPDKFRLVLTGGKPKSKQVQEFIENMGVSERITWLPFLDFHEMMSYLHCVDAGVMFVGNNDLGNYFGAEGRMTQYLACGLPIIASEHAGIESLIRRYNVGVCVDSHSAVKISKAIELLETNVKNGEYKRNRITDVFINYFSFEHWESLITESFNNLICENSNKNFMPPKYPWMPDY